MTAPYSPEVRDILRRAGMSENSELTLQEWRNAQEAVRRFGERPTARRDEIYRVIRPRTDEDD